MKFYIVSLMVLIPFIVVVQGGGTDEEWEAWKTEYDKKYDTPEEEARRREIWNAKKDEVDAHNAKFDSGEVTYKQGLNQYSDLTSEEWPIPGVLPNN